MSIVNQKLKFTASVFFLVLGAMMFSIAEGLAPSGANAACPETQCPSGQVCCGGSCIDSATMGCCGDVAYNLDEGCCVDE